MHVARERHTELLGDDAWLTDAVDKLTPPHRYQETTALRLVEPTPGDLRRTAQRPLPATPVANPVRSAAGAVC
ncbi:hypothetical protein [Kitasatospora sp. NPDC058190]|uniref:hypothetical protein n=1 Tax=Kitasatospora sp. NPDC058190 TaxID=3346371 RepID=UPI0036D885B7